MLQPGGRRSGCSAGLPLRLACPPGAELGASGLHWQPPPAVNLNLAAATSAAALVARYRSCADGLRCAAIRTNKIPLPSRSVRFLGTRESRGWPRLARRRSVYLLRDSEPPPVASWCRLVPAGAGAVPRPATRADHWSPSRPRGLAGLEAPMRGSAAVRPGHLLGDAALRAAVSPPRAAFGRRGAPCTVFAIDPS